MTLANAGQYPEASWLSWSESSNHLPTALPVKPVAGACFRLLGTQGCDLGDLQFKFHRAHVSFGFTAWKRVQPKVPFQAPGFRPL